MKIVKETDPRFINLKPKIATFVLVALGGIVFFIVTKGLQEDLFAAKTNIYFIANSGKDLYEGQSVTLSGFKIGKVRDVLLDDVAKVKVRLSVNDHYLKWIRKDSKARLVKELFIVDKTIEILPGSSGAAPVESNDTIAFERETGLDEIVEKINQDILPLFSDLRALVHDADSPQGEMKKTMVTLKSTVTKLDLLLDSLQSTVRRADHVVSKADALVDSMDKTTAKTAGLVDRLAEDVPGILRKVDQSTENLKKMTDDITPRIPYMIDKWTFLADDAGEVVDALKQVWPISSHIKKREKRESQPAGKD